MTGRPPRFLGCDNLTIEGREECNGLQNQSKKAVVTMTMSGLRILTPYQHGAVDLPLLLWKKHL